MGDTTACVVKLLADENDPQPAEFLALTRQKYVVPLFSVLTCLEVDVSDESSTM